MIEIITYLQLDDQNLNKPVDTYITEFKLNDNYILTWRSPISIATLVSEQRTWAD